MIDSRGNVVDHLPTKEAADAEIERCLKEDIVRESVKLLFDNAIYSKSKPVCAEVCAAYQGGAMSMLPEIRFDVPGTAHFIGGCVIADSPERGVVDVRHRVFGYQNMHVCDGSVVAANLGVNPSLTITELAERAISFIPPASETNWNEPAV